jgi:hypothetical protein
MFLNRFLSWGHGNLWRDTARHHRHLAITLASPSHKLLLQKAFSVALLESQLVERSPSVKC